MLSRRRASSSGVPNACLQSQRAHITSRSARGRTHDFGRYAVILRIGLAAEVHEIELEAEHGRLRGLEVLRLLGVAADGRDAPNGDVLLRGDECDKVLREREAHHVLERDVDIVAVLAEQLHAVSRSRVCKKVDTDLVSDPAACDPAGRDEAVLRLEVLRALVEERAYLVLCRGQRYGGTWRGHYTPCRRVSQAGHCAGVF